MCVEMIRLNFTAMSPRDQAVNIAMYDRYDQPDHTNGLVQERRNSSALAMELRLSCTNPSIYMW